MSVQVLSETATHKTIRVFRNGVPIIKTVEKWHTIEARANKQLSKKASSHTILSPDGTPIKSKGKKRLIKQAGKVLAKASLDRELSKTGKVFDRLDNFAMKADKRTKPDDTIGTKERCQIACEPRNNSERKP